MDFENYSKTISDIPAGGESMEKTHREPTATASSVFPVTHSILSASSLQAEVARAYEIGTPISCQLLGVSTNDTYLLTTRDNRYILRVSKANHRSVSEISYEVDLLQHLSLKGISVPVPLAKKIGNFVHQIQAPEGTRQIVLFNYAKGTSLLWDRMDHIFLAGQFAAMIHTASDDFMSSHSRFRLDLDYLIETPLARLRLFLAERPDESTYLEEFASRLRRCAETAISAGLDWGVCHGDYQASNIKFTEDQKLTILDFDYCGPGWRAFDFAFIKWFASSPGKTAIWDCFLKGYTETRKFDGADLAAVPVFHAMSHLWALGAYAGNANRWGIQFMTGGYFDSELAFFRKWEADHLE